MIQGLMMSMPLIVDAIALGATGKILKGQLPERFHNHRWPGGL
jgi:hypothetical protein